MNGQINTHNGFRDKVEVNVNRPASFAQLVMGSEDRYSSESAKFNSPINASDFIIEAKQPFLSGYFTRLAIPSINFKYAVPTIVQGVNDILQFSYYSLSNPTVSLGSYTLAMLSAFYTPQSMAAMINAKITAVYPSNPAGVVVTAGNNGLVFTCGAGYGIAFTATNASTTKRITRLYNVLGVTGTNIIGSSIFGGPANVVYCSAFQSNYTSYIDICSDTLTKYQNVKDNATRPFNNKSGVIARIYTTPFNTKEYTNDDLESSTASGGTTKVGPYTIDTDYNNPKWIKWNPDEYIYQIDIQMYDDYGEPLYWTPRYNSEFDMTILASES